MQYTADGRNMTAKYEGCRLKAYKDSVGVLTIGYGHTKGVQEGDECTQYQADVWLDEDIQRVVDALNKDLKVPVTQSEFNALVDFAFNLGVHALEGSTLWRKLSDGDYEGAAREFPRWNKAGGKEVAGLIARRKEEQEMFLKGLKNETL